MWDRPFIYLIPVRNQTFRLQNHQKTSNCTKCLSSLCSTWLASCCGNSVITSCKGCVKWVSSAWHISRNHKVTMQVLFCCENCSRTQPFHGSKLTRFQWSSLSWGACLARQVWCYLGCLHPLLKCVSINSARAHLGGSRWWLKIPGSLVTHVRGLDWDPGNWLVHGLVLAVVSMWTSWHKVSLSLSLLSNMHTHHTHTHTYIKKKG